MVQFPPLPINRINLPENDMKESKYRSGARITLSRAETSGGVLILLADSICKRRQIGRQCCLRMTVGAATMVVPGTDDDEYCN